MTDMIGFIGVGTMGEPMCRNLARKSGATVLAADRNPEPLQRLAADGVKAASMDEIVASCRTIFLSLPGGKEVEQVCLGEGGILSKVQMGWTIVDTSTAPVALARRLYAEFEGHACAFADAPIARTRQAAIDGTLSIMVGGEAEAFQRARPLFEQVGKTILLQGPPGSGQHTKMVNQILIAGTMVGVGEALTYARAAGLDLEHVLASVGSGAAASWTLQNLAPRIIRGDLAPGFYVEHFIKDLGIALAEAEAMHLALPGLALAKQLYHTVVAYGGARNGTQAIVLALEAMSGGRALAGRPAFADIGTQAV